MIIHWTPVTWAEDKFGDVCPSVNGDTFEFVSEILKPGMLARYYDDKHVLRTVLIGHANTRGGTCECCNSGIIKDYALVAIGIVPDMDDLLKICNEEE